MVESVDWTADDAARLLPSPTASDDKYSRGVLGVRTGSDAYPGAAVLGVEAASRTGLGMVRYLGPPRAADLVLARRPETVTAEGRVQAWLIGSGTDAAARTPAETEALRVILSGGQPVVVDAGALDLARGATAPRILTPHAGEFARLSESLGLGGELPPRFVWTSRRFDAVGSGEKSTQTDGVRGGARAAAVRELAERLGAVVLLKGSETVVADPDGWCATVSAGTAWLATAGTGDVLGGILGALLAAAGGPGDLRLLAELAATSVFVHGRAGVAASERAGGGPVTALDVAEAVPPVVGRLLSGRSNVAADAQEIGHGRVIPAT